MGATFMLVRLANFVNRSPPPNSAESSPLRITRGIRSAERAAKFT